MAPSPPVPTSASAGRAIFARKVRPTAGALEECGRRCRILFQFKDSCAAYASGRAGAAGWEISNSETHARDIALERCRRHSRDCRLRMSACS